MSFILRLLAEQDLESIWLYSLEQWGVQQADTYIHSLTDRFLWLSEQPLLGKQRNDIKEAYYCFPEGEHVIFYKIRNDKQVDIIGIPHHSMDILSHINSETK